MAIRSRWAFRQLTSVAEAVMAPGFTRSNPPPRWYQRPSPPVASQLTRPPSRHRAVATPTAGPTPRPNVNDAFRDANLELRLAFRPVPD